MDTNAPSFTRLSDADLILEVSRLAERERVATADLIAALIELEDRRLYLGEGCGSLFAYCTTRLSLSESAAYVRIEAARAARAFPLVLDRLRAGMLTLTAVKLLAPHLSEGNHREVIAAAEGRTTEQVKELVARLAPRPDVPSSIRKLPAWRAEAPRSGRPREPKRALPADSGHDASPALLLSALVPADALTFPVAAVVASPPPPPRRTVVQLLSPARYQLQMTVSADTRAKLRQLQDLLRREIPSGDPAVIVDRALSLLLEHVERRKFAATRGARTRPAAGRAAEPASSPSADLGAPAVAERAAAAAGTSPPIGARRSRGIPAAVKREVWRRDGGQCSYVGRTGRCSSRGPLEFHHLVPVADGGAATVANLTLRCAAHHDAESARVFDWRRIPEAPAAAAPTRFETTCGPTTSREEDGRKRLAAP